MVEASPIASLTGVPLNAPINIEFSKEILLTSLSNVRLLQNGTVVPTTLTTTQANTIVVLTPNALLLPNKVYTISASGVMDVQGTSMTGTYTSTFTTGAVVDLLAAPTGSLRSHRPTERPELQTLHR